MLYSLQQFMHKVGLHFGPGVLPGGQAESAVSDRKESVSATYDDASTWPQG